MPSLYVQLYKDFLQDSVVKVKFGMEGQVTHVVDNSHYIVLGNRAGPQCCFDNLLHEVAHFAEREPNKLVMLLKNNRSNWAFHYGKYWQIGTQWGYEPQTDQAVQREARVWAYQISLQKHYNIYDNVYDLVKSVVYIPAWCYYKPAKKYDDRKNLLVLSRYVERLSKEFTYERFCEEWDKRNKLLKNHTFKVTTDV